MKAAAGQWLFAFMWWVYILYSEKLNKYYVGRTEDLELRLHFHNNPIEARKYTAKGLPWVLCKSIPCDTKAQSIKMEKLIKGKKSRKFVESLLTDESKVLEIIDLTSR